MPGVWHIAVDNFMLRRMSNDVTEMETIMKEICQTDTHNDFITMEVLGTREITPEKKYLGIGINLMAHIKNVRIPFSVDIGVDEVILREDEFFGMWSSKENVWK